MRTHSQPLTATELSVLGFENVAQWSVVTGPVTIANNTAFKSEGAKSLSMSGMQYASVRNSAAIAKDGTPAPSIVGFDLRVPASQPNPSWHGAVELYVSAPSVGVNNQFLGTLPLLNVPKGSFQRMNFNVPVAVRNALNGGNYNDLKFTIGLNVPAGAQTHYLDKFTLGPATCTPISDNNVCTTDTCNPANGQTVYTPVAAGTACADGNACNGAELCNGSGVCQAGTPPAVDDGNLCTTDACNPASGVTHVAVAAGTSCTDGNACNGAEACNGSGVCQAGTPPGVDDGNVCTADSCNPASGVTHVPASAGTSCTDGNACNGAEACNSSGTCLAGTPPIVDDGNACTADACDPVRALRTWPLRLALCAQTEMLAMVPRAAMAAVHASPVPRSSSTMGTPVRSTLAIRSLAPLIFRLLQALPAQIATFVTAPRFVTAEEHAKWELRFKSMMATSAPLTRVILSMV